MKLRDRVSEWFLAIAVWLGSWRFPWEEPEIELKLDAEDIDFNLRPGIAWDPADPPAIFDHDTLDIPVLELAPEETTDEEDPSILTSEEACLLNSWREFRTEYLDVLKDYRYSIRVNFGTQDVEVMTGVFGLDIFRYDAAAWGRVVAPKGNTPN